MTRARAKNWSGSAALALLAGLIASGLSACQGPKGVPEPAAPRSVRVRIIGMERLSPPEISHERVYLPDEPWMLESAEGSIGAIGFFITVSAEGGADLRLRVRDVDRLATVPVDRIEVPGDAPLRDLDGVLDDEEVRGLLVQGTGVFWSEPPIETARGTTYRLGVLLADGALGSRTTVEAYASTTSTGAPLGGDRIELARKFFYMAALGDSAMWGNGLEDKDKFSTLVGRTIERELGVRVVRVVRAVSGAAILPADGDALCTTNCSGEVPERFTSITLQADSLERPELFDLILLDGCGNDIGLPTILASDDHSEVIRESASAYCLGEMANLLIRVRARAPQAPIVVTGYFPFVSRKSDLSEVGAWAAANDIDLGPIEDIEPALLAYVVNSQTFHEASGEALAAAVELVDNLSPSDPPIAFVAPAFEAQHATFASDAWLWGLTANVDIARRLNISLSVFPEDSLVDERIDLCGRPDVAPDLLSCVYASVGHPNPAGARAYAVAIESALRAMGVLPEVPAAP